MGRLEELLRAARERVARPGGWCQGAYGRSAAGQELPLLSEGSRAAAVSVCSRGACFMVADPFGSEVEDMMQLLRRANYGASVITWNDEVGRTQGDVVALFDKAVELAAKAW